MKGDRNKARGRSPGSLRWGALVMGLVVAMALIAAESPGSPGHPQRIGTESAAPARLSRSAPPARTSHLVNVRGTGGAAPCNAPPLPAATNPPGAPYGVPFVAQLSGGELLGGYDLQLASHGANPWRATISNITGWVSGRLQVPNLQAKIVQLFFCNPGVLPSAGGIKLALVSPGALTVTNDGSCQNPLPGTAFMDDRITLTPQPTKTTLAITGVEPDGSVDLTGTTVAGTKIVFTSVSAPPACTPGSQQTCTQYADTQIPLATRLAPAPPGAPAGVVYPLQPSALQGPINSGTATLVGNNFKVPAFIDAANGGCFISVVFNGTLAGFDINGVSRYHQGEPQPRVAGQAGWSEFQATTKITGLG